MNTMRLVVQVMKFDITEEFLDELMCVINKSSPRHLRWIQEGHDFDRSLEVEIKAFLNWFEEEDQPDTWVDDVFLAPNGPYEQTWLNR